MHHQVRKQTLSSEVEESKSEDWRSRSSLGCRRPHLSSHLRLTLCKIVEHEGSQLEMFQKYGKYLLRSTVVA